MKYLMLLLFPLLCLSCLHSDESAVSNITESTFDEIQSAPKRLDLLKMGPGKYDAFHAAIRTRTDKKNAGYPLNYKSTALQKAKKNRRHFKRKNLDWQERGPANVAGRTRDIIYDPRDPTYSTWIVGSAGGGVWKTEDAGESWKHVTEDLPNLSTTTVVSSIANPDVIYVGTGDGIGGTEIDNRGIPRRGIGGSGLFKSIDNGESFDLLVNAANDPRFKNVTRMVVSATDENTVWASTFTTFRNVSPGITSYIMKSIDGGDTWVELYNSTHRIQQIVLHPENESILYACINSDGVYKTKDGGTTWKLVFKASDFDINRMELAISPSNTDVIYFAAESFKSRLFKSSDAGENWFEVVNSEKVFGNWMGLQGWYDNSIAVHPYNEESVFVGGAGPILNVKTTNEILPLLDFYVEHETDFLAAASLVISGADKAISRQSTNSLDLEDYIEIELNFGEGETSAYVFSENYNYTGRAAIPVTALDKEGNTYTLAFVDSNESGRWDVDEENVSFSIEDMIIYKIPDTSEPIDRLENNFVFYKAMYFFSTVFQESVNENDILRGTANIKQERRDVLDSSFKPITDGYFQYGLDFPNVGRKGVHVDHHNLIMIPLDNSANFYILNANDGGVAFSRNAGRSFLQTGNVYTFNNEPHLNGYNSSQFYGVDKMNGSDRYVGGTQDNRSWISGEDPDETSTWKMAPGGDGFEAAWHYTDPNLILESSQFNRLFKSYNCGKNWVSARLPESDGPFVTRIANSKQEPNFVCMISSIGILKSLDFGETWEPSTMSNNWSFNAFGAPTEISLASPFVVWTGATSSTIAVSTDAASSFNMTNDYPLLSQGILTGLATHPVNPNKAYALYSLNDLPKILMTEDLGQTWTDLSGFDTERTESQNGFPNVGTTSLLVMPYDTTIIWAGTEIGLFESTDNGQSWYYADNGLPPVSIWEMKIVNDEVILATHGRGIWSVSIPELDGYEPIQSHKFPNIESAYAFAGDVNAAYDLNSPYDSTRVSFKLPDQPNPIFKETHGSNNEAVTKTSNFDVSEYIIEDSITEAIFIVEAFVDGKSAKIEKVVELYNINVEVIYPYDNNLQGTESSFAKSGFNESLVISLGKKGLHTPHPYESDSKYVAILQDPIVIQDKSEQLSFDEIALVDTGDFRYPDSDEFEDYVQVSATNNRGRDWVRLEQYDGRANTMWLNFTEMDVGRKFIANRVIDLSQFEVSDTLYFRFELLSGRDNEGWGWFLDNFKYGEVNTAVNDLDFDIDSLSLYPNPAKELTTLEINLKEKGNLSVQLFDLSGKLVLDVFNDVMYKGINELIVDVSSLHTGMYLTVIASQHQKSSLKLIKE